MAYQPRKPTEFGIEMHTTTCAESKVMVNAEVSEGKEREALKDYRDQVG